MTETQTEIELETETEPVTDPEFGTITEFEGRDYVRPMQVAKVAEVRPQMVYNYINLGYIAATRNEDDKLIVPLDAAATFVHGYKERKAARAAKKLAALSESESES